MPFRTKPTGIQQSGVPSTVNFDTLWHKAISPAIEQIGYEPVRADQDRDALIINQMLERLVLADLVIADVTLPNPNVFYEIGIRHAAKKDNCVLISADWAQIPFDLKQMRQVKYGLSEGEITDESARNLKTYLAQQTEQLKSGKSPVSHAIPGYKFPKQDKLSTTSFENYAHKLYDFQSKTRQFQIAPKKDRKKLASQLLKEYPPNSPGILDIKLEIIETLQDWVGWSETLEYINGLPSDIQQLPQILEKKLLAISETGSYLESISALNTLVDQYGNTSDRQGIIGGRYKRLYESEEDVEQKKKYLDLAIAHYEQGMLLDLNDFYPSGNLPRLYRTRNNKGDKIKADNTAKIAHEAAKRSLSLNLNNEWARPTLLCAAFDIGNLANAELLYEEIRTSNLADWKLQSVSKDLRLSIRLHSNPETVAGLQEILDEILTLL